MMTLQEMYDVALQSGMATDPRGREAVEALLARAQEKYEALKPEDRWEFDEERLTNPYADTRILNGSPETDVRGVLVGIDIEVGEILLGDRLRRDGRPIDLIMAHHPEGRALSRLDDVMAVQADVWRHFGVSIAFGDAAIGERMQEIMRAIHPGNNQRSVSAAKLLDIPFMCCHTAADNNVNAFVQQKCDELGSDGTVDALIKMLKEIPEYRQAVIEGNGPVVFEGSGERRTGRIMVDMTGGTSGPVEAISRLAAAGVGTIVAMHMGEEHRKKAGEEKMSVVIAGHIASDSLGMNLILDEYEKRGVEVLACSGMMRVSRV
jgi:hypothetical protein